MVRRIAYPLLLVTALCTLGAGIAAGIGWRLINEPLVIEGDSVWVTVPAGASLSRVMGSLAEEGILRYPRLVTSYARLRGDATRIHAGEYRLASGTTSAQLLRKLVTGQVYLHHLTIVEGWRFADLWAAVRSDPAIRMTSVDATTLMEQLGEPGLDPEGQFFPDTYSFARDTPDIELLRQAHEALRTKLAEVWDRREPGIVLQDPYQALILASIIEKETALPSERKLISGVFHRRLERGMRLQTDPTVIYGLGQGFDGNLRREDLARDTPYNTYTRAGLPPTPIALPGLAALDAAVMPDPGDALYFVATGEPDGSHHFSATLQEHNEAVAKYLERARSASEP
jgi:peptidoglycan lytic transglycosylase G